MANEGDGWAGSGGHPWHLDEETECILFLTNMGDHKTDIGFQVQAGGVHYFLTRLRLAAHETRAIDLRKQRDAQQPDFRENTIPAGATDGSVLWIRLENLPVMGRLVVFQWHHVMPGTTSKAPLAHMDAYTIVAFLPSQATLRPPSL